MDNQHKLIKGYRDLSEKEIATMNKVKDLGEQLAEILKEVEQLEDADKRCVAIGKTNLQQGIMWTVRAVARPESF